MMWRGVLLMALVAALALAVSGCWNPFSPDGGNGNGEPPGDRKTRDNLLDFFARAYMDKSIDRFGEALDDDYTFEFWKKDYPAAGVDSINPYWGRTEDIERTTSMFINPQTMSISFNFNLPMVPWYQCDDVINVDGQPQVVNAFCSTWKPDIQVTVEGETEPTTYWVNASWILVTVIQDRKDPSLWTILRLEETLELP
jgi:hypothetical protein